MRIFLLPLTTRQALVYCHKIAAKPTGKLSIVDRIQNKATETWSSWEAAEKGWKKQIITYGNHGLKRIPYQEWGLKSFPPSTPDLQAQQVTDAQKFEVVYPANVMHKDDVPKVLARLASERKTLHWNRFIGSMIAIPFTVPFAIIPIPNIPFFYVAYRCWSHWRALKGSDHLDFILDHRLFKLHSTPEVESLYNKIAPQMIDSFSFVTRSQVEDGTAPEERAILSRGNHSIVAKSLEVPELGTEVERAIWQVQNALEKEAQDKEAQDQKAKEVQSQQAAQEKIDEKLKK